MSPLHQSDIQKHVQVHKDQGEKEKSDKLSRGTCLDNPD